MFCEKCGKEIQENSLLCNECLKDESISTINDNDSVTDSQVQDYNESVQSIECECTDDVVSITESTDCYSHKVPNRIRVRRNKRIGVHVAATFFSVLLALLLILTSSLIIIREAVSPNVIKQMINNIDLTQVMIDDESEKAILEEHGLISNSDNLFDIIYDNIEQSELPHSISKDEFKAIVENEEFREYFGQLFGLSIEALTSGDRSDVVTPEDVVDYLASNRDELSEILGYELTDERLENLRITLEEDYGKVFQAIGDKKLNVLFGDTVADIINIIFSNWLLLALILADILVIFLLFVVLRSVTSCVKYCGITMITVGVIYLCIAIAILNGLFYLFNGGPLMYIMNQLVSVILWEAIVISIFMILIGIVTPITEKIIRRYKKRHVI